MLNVRLRRRIHRCSVYVGWSALVKWQALPIKVTESFNIPCAHVLSNRCYCSVRGHALTYQAGSDGRSSVWTRVVCLAPQAVRDGHPHGGLCHYRDNYDLERLGHYVEAAVYGEYQTFSLWDGLKVIQLKIRKRNISLTHILSLSLSQRNEGDLFHRLWHVMNEILELRQQVLVGHLTHDRLSDIKQHITARLDWGNEWVWNDHPC